MYKTEKTARFFDLGKRLTAKYGDILEGIDNDYVRSVTAILLENETTWLESMDEATRLVNVGSFDKYVYPLVRRTYPSLIVNDIVSVQPMTGPQGLIFYLKFKYGSNKGAITSGSEYLGNNVSNFDETYSSSTIKNESYGTGDGATTVFGHTASYLPVLAGTVTVTAGAVVGTDDGAGNITGAGIAAGTINYTTGVMSVTYSVAPANLLAITTTYRYNNEANAQVPEIDMDISKLAVTANTRKLRSKWSPEAAQDLKNLHGLDAEVELVTILSQEIALETNHEVIMDLYNNSNSSATWVSTPGAGISYREYKDTFIDTLVSLSNTIYSKTLRGEANFVVCSTEVSTVIETLPGFVPAASNPVRGIGFIGTLNSRWNIFKDPFMPANKSVVGYKGESFLDTGYVYSPYVPLMATPTIQNADDFINRKGLMSRYAKAVINDRFYGVLTKA